MNVCFVVPTLTSGGAERVVATLANHWGEQGWTVSVLVLDQTHFPPAYALSPSVRLESIELFDKPTDYLRKVTVTVRQVYRLRRTIRRVAPQVVVSFIDVTSLLTRLATTFSGIPLVVSERSNPRAKQVNPLLKWINYHFVFRWADGIVVQTRRVEEYLSTATRQKTAVIPNPVRMPPPPYRRTVADEPHRRIITVGRLEYPKAYDTLLRAFARVLRVHPGWQLMIVGQGSLAEPLRTLSAELGLSGHVRWVAQTEDVYATLSAADIFVLSSRYEGFPNALCEAMACGRAVVATDCDFGPREIITDGQNGLLAPVDQPEALAECLGTLIDDRELRATLGERARGVTTTYSLEKIAGRWEAFLRDIVRRN